MKKRNWDQTRQAFMKLVFKSTPADVAKEIPASVRTVYRILNGQVKRPTKAIRAGIDDMVDRSTEP